MVLYLEHLIIGDYFSFLDAPAIYVILDIFTECAVDETPILALEFAIVQSDSGHFGKFLTSAEITLRTELDFIKREREF